MTDRMARYLEYVKSDHWRALRKQKRKQVGCRCENCAATVQLHTHHLIYRDFYDCTLDDLMILCEPCHNLIHWVLKKSGIDMNGVSRDRTMELLRWAPEQHSYARRQEKIERKKLRPSRPPKKRKKEVPAILKRLIKARKVAKKAIQVFFNRPTPTLPDSLTELIAELTAVQAQLSVAEVKSPAPTPAPKYTMQTIAAYFDELGENEPF